MQRFFLFAAVIGSTLALSAGAEARSYGPSRSHDGGDRYDRRDRYDGHDHYDRHERTYYRPSHDFDFRRRGYDYRGFRYSHYYWSDSCGCYFYWAPDYSCWCFYEPQYSCYVPTTCYNQVYPESTVTPFVPPSPFQQQQQQQQTIVNVNDVNNGPLPVPVGGPPVGPIPGPVPPAPPAAGQTQLANPPIPVGIPPR